MRFYRSMWIKKMKINAKQKCPIKGAANRQLKKKKPRGLILLKLRKEGVSRVKETRVKMCIVK